MAKLLTVFGATGQQGGALINHVLGNEQLSSLFRLRGITRDAAKPASIALKNKGVEIGEADLNIRSSLDDAVAGSYAVFGVTNFWEQASTEVEVSQGKAIADAAVAAGVTQMIWSSLPNVKDSPAHFVSKAEVEEYIRTLHIKSMFFMPGWFMQNHLVMMRPQKMDDGTYEFFQPWSPSTKLPLIDIRDTGKYIAPALLDPDLYHGKRFTCATAFVPASEMADTWTQVTGKTVKLRVSNDATDYSSLTEEQKKETKTTDFDYFGPTGQDDLVWTQEQVTEKLRTWEWFVRDNEPWFS